MRAFGSSAEPWWKRAVFYQIPDSAAIDYKVVATKLDAMQSIGVDALIVPAPPLPIQSAASVNDAIAAQASLDEFDNFTRQSTSRGIHVLLLLSAARADAELAGRTRFWLTRGVSGFRIVTPPETDLQDRAAIVQAVRVLTGSVAGERIVLADSLAVADNSLRPAIEHSATSRRATAGRNTVAAPLLQLDTHIGQLSSPSAAALRPLLAQSLTQPNLLLDTRPQAPEPDIARLLAAIALTTNSAALIDPAVELVLPDSAPRAPEPEQGTDKPAPAPIPAQPPPGVYLPYKPYVPPPRPHAAAPAPLPPPPDPLAAWYGQLAALHHGNTALRTGSKVFLDFDAQNALVWVARPATPTPQNPPVIVLCNLSSSPVQLSLADTVKKLNLHGFFLRTLARSDSGMGAQDLNAVSLPPFSVFIGELRR